jgi:uncharacterized membrane protein YccC
MFDFLGAGIGAIVGTLSGIATAVLLRWLFPHVGDASYLHATLIALGFAVGVWFDVRRPKD